MRKLPSILCCAVSFRFASLAFGCAVLMAGLGSFSTARAEDPSAIDLAKSLEVHLPSDIEGVSHEVVMDENDKIPVLNLRFPDKDLKGQWRAWVDYKIPETAKGNYTLIFQAKSDQAEVGIDVRILDKQANDVKLLAPVKGFALSTEWNEYTLDFTVEDGYQGTPSIRWGNLAKSGQTISLREVRLSKE